MNEARFEIVPMRRCEPLISANGEGEPIARSEYHIASHVVFGCSFPCSSPYKGVLQLTVKDVSPIKLIGKRPATVDEWIATGGFREGVGQRCRKCRQG